MEQVAGHAFAQIKLGKCGIGLHQRRYEGIAPLPSSRRISSRLADTPYSSAWSPYAVLKSELAKTHKFSTPRWTLIVCPAVTTH